MKDLSGFLQNIRLYAPGVATPTAYFAIRQAAIEFCERTRMWRYEDELDVAGDECDAISAPDCNSVIHQIEEVWFDGKKLDHKSPQQLDDLAPNWRSGADTSESQPHYVTQSAPDTIALVPRGTGTVKFTLFLKPSQSAEQVPDWLVDQHTETIAFGALARLLLIPNQSFTNPEMGGGFALSFAQRLDGKFMAGVSGQQRAQARAKATFY